MANWSRGWLEEILIIEVVATAEGAMSGDRIYRVIRS